MELQEEKVKYYKKKDQSSKAEKKSDHKHSYDRHLIVIVPYEHITILQCKKYCSICGKIGGSLSTRCLKEEPETTYPFKGMTLTREMTLKELQAEYPAAKLAEAKSRKQAWWADNVSEFGVQPPY